MRTDPTPDLCCTHGERIDRLVDLVELLVAVRKPTLSAEEARKAEDIGLRVADCTSLADDEPVFVVDVESRPRPEQGHIVNTPKFQAALEEFRQDYEQGRLDE